jgi:hypothetical protein
MNIPVPSSIKSICEILGGMFVRGLKAQCCGTSDYENGCYPSRSRDSLIANYEGRY